MPPALSLSRLLVAVLPAASLFFSACTSPVPRSQPVRMPTLAAPVLPEGTDALPRWREHFEAFHAATGAIEENLIAFEAADAPLPDIPDARLSPALAELDHFTLAPGETLVLPPLHGPETPFPDHHPLRQIASLRTIQTRRALAAGDIASALSLIRQNLAQARATLESQAGLIPLVHAVGVWQSALDGAHAAARSPGLSEADARTLLAELQNDAGLASRALDRTLRGEYLHVYRVIVERMPKTDDPDLALSAVASLGMVEPEPLDPGELGLGLTEHVLLDPAATLAAYEADLAPYLASLASSSRFPRGLYDQITAPALRRYHEQLGAFYRYAGGEEAPTLELILQARAAMESTPNPIGKLLAIYLTPPWDVIMATTFRREAQRSAVCALLAWRIHGRPVAWHDLVAAGILAEPPADPFSNGALRFALGDSPRVWSVFLDAVDNGGQPVEGNIGQPDDLVWIY